MSAHRVTVVSDQRILATSDFKRWRGGSNTDRVCEFNGLRLSPHIDALFDDHQTSFDDDSRAHCDPSFFAECL